MGQNKSWFIRAKGFICKSNWPFLVAFIVATLNTEFAIPFVLVGIFELTGHNLSLAAGIWASTELCWWFWFSGWLYREKIRKISTVAEAIDISQKAAKGFDLREFLRPNLGDLYPVVLVKDFARKHGIENFDIDNYQDNPIFIAIRRFGYIISCVFIFIFGLLPLFWILGLMVCRATKWKLALALLFISNFLKNYYLAQVYEKIGFWWFALFFVAFILTMSYIVKSIIKKLKAYNNQTAS
ncbi:MAG: hypothetical protein A3B91_04885 [Candidatus Yanofskybacteria bacterium RIFCSPHIGHO2_02_FULL_41_29]|uniref:Uncharacterized protein n=1 Tax=Candidatus Yanofskybacteria bacterium RIFCSPHIGHO2_01_FULL_41_53 TaxID=1802663 RepID=A0A1F8EGI8_9BACT|nr:MAG: hypothetical protein A2650_01495 [Candidatus Yanofskybacteria bacterium RIFCSPHIGHO2_01_FULL_41_53]OGN11156.1 MAG: hypothetical protein A3B91_04885 [Candidatus Yanofskybacteria bacterium RIFCSPHIGHO2_02_FULL_41_29]OGN16822.1 MAG: hypothetical protein A3F48_04185 [Candidatus Yanofskybacteria bacterium RIFCSPHIGHO2_12_FULL_41_9]OGN22070.1 MAG: hypothetical protein A2916_00105 [Candidatus Yanofskybacteria bacterium RIFCSPLOWO2_01_FULL_41_67]OGN28523.1 MAG: hypothetical protein A3H54_04665 